MSSKPVLYKILAAIMVVTILGGCTSNTAQPVPTATPTTAPITAPTTALITAPTTVPTTAPTTAPTVAVPTETIAPTLDQNLVNTQSAQTAAANLTLNAPTATPVPPLSTSTSAPTVTRLPPTAFPTATFNPVLLTPSSTPTGYNCSVTSTSPKSTDTVTINTDFNWSWVITNTGIKLWGQHAADLKYISGTAMQTGGSVVNLTSDVAPGASYTATIAMRTPATAGTYTAAWQIVQDGVLVCTLNLSVKVTN